MDLDADDNVPPIEDVPLFRDVAIGQLESLRVSSTLHPSEILFPKLFIDNQPSLKELEVDFNNVGTFSVLKALLLHPRVNVCIPDPSLGSNLNSLTIIRVHTFAWNSDGRGWSAFIDALPGLKCLELFIDDRDRIWTDGKEDPGASGDYFLGLKTRIIEYGIIFAYDYGSRFLTHSTSANRFVSLMIRDIMMIRNTDCAYI